MDRLVVSRLHRRGQESLRVHGGVGLEVILERAGARVEVRRGHTDLRLSEPHQVRLGDRGAEDMGITAADVGGREVEVAALHGEPDTGANEREPPRRSDGTPA